jgi:acyl-coenzyme A thioesterase PaaI-like protein
MSGEKSAGLELPPYAQSLGMFVERMEGDVPLIACEAGDLVLGRPGFWHGGVIGGLLEIAALTAIRSALGIDGKRLKPVNITVQFMRAATMQRAYAIGSIERAGRRLVNVTASAWQEDRARHIAGAQMTVLLTPEDG